MLQKINLGNVEGKIIKQNKTNNTQLEQANLVPLHNTRLIPYSNREEFIGQNK